MDQPDPGMHGQQPAGQVLVQTAQHDNQSILLPYTPAPPERVSGSAAGRPPCTTGKQEVVCLDIHGGRHTGRPLEEAALHIRLREIHIELMNHAGQELETVEEIYLSPLSKQQKTLYWLMVK